MEVNDCYYDPKLSKLLRITSLSNELGFNPEKVVSTEQISFSRNIFSIQEGITPKEVIKKYYPIKISIETYNEIRTCIERCKNEITRLLP